MGKKMNKKSFLNGVPDYNKKFFKEQFEKAEENEMVDNTLPLKLFLPCLKLASGNDLVAKHHFIVQRYKKRCVRHMELNGIRKTKKVKKKRKVTFLRLYPKGGRMLDGDNLQTGFKYLRDHLVRTGWLYEDSPAWILPTYEDRKPYDWESWGISITVEEIK